MPLMDGQAFPDWAKGLVDAGLEGTDRPYRVNVLARIADAARDGAWKEIDGVLVNVSSDLAETSLATLLRGTYRFREKLVGWESFRTRVGAELDARASTSVSDYRRGPSMA